MPWRLGGRTAGGETADDAGERPADLSGLEPNLRMREAERGQTRRSMGLVSTPVTRLLSRGPVVAQPVGLDDQAQLGPEEVNAKTVQTDTGLGNGQAGGAHQPEESPLQLRLRQAEDLAVKEAKQTCRAVQFRQRSTEPLEIHEVSHDCFIYGSLELCTRQLAGDICERPDRTGDWDSMPSTPICRHQNPSAMHDDPVRPMLVRNGH